MYFCAGTDGRRFSLFPKGYLRYDRDDGALIREDVQFSQILALPAVRVGTLKKAPGQLLANIFTGRSADVSNKNCMYPFDHGSAGYQNFSRFLGAIKGYCTDDLTPARDFEAMCLALVPNQMIKNLSLSLDQSPVDPVTKGYWWKWLAYSLFSKRARACSTPETLDLLIVSVSVLDAMAFSSILSSEHPEEELLLCPRDHIHERDAMLRSRAPIREFDDTGLTYQALEDQHFLFQYTPFELSVAMEEVNG